MSALPQSTVEAREGFLWDIETGELIGPVVPDKFEVKDDASLEWVLNKFLQSEAAKAAVDNSDLVLAAKAVLANAEAIKNDHTRRIESLHRRFDTEIRAYASAILAGRSTRTLKTVAGSVSFRHVAGGLKVADEELALTWADENCPEAIKTVQKFLISQVPDSKKAKIGDLPVPEVFGFTLTEPEDRMTIKTGV